MMTMFLRVTAQDGTALALAKGTRKRATKTSKGETQVQSCVRTSPRSKPSICMRKTSSDNVTVG